MSEIRVENIVGETGTDAVKFTKGINVTGVTTATSFSGSGANLTSLPAANLTGALPAISGANLTGVSAGKVLQVLSTNGGSSAQTTSGSCQATGLSQAITMTSASNKVLVTASGTVNNGSADAGGYFTLYRGSTNLATNGDNIAGFWGEDNSNNITTTITMTFLDTPGTGTHTYAVYYKVWGGGSIRWGYLDNSSITCIEVVA